MDDVWFQKLLLPTLDNVPVPVLISILNSWYESRKVCRRNRLKSLLIKESEANLLTFLKRYTTHSIIAWESAAVVVKQKNWGGNINVFIPVYGDLDKHFVLTLQNMISKVKGDSTSNSPQVKKLLEFSSQVISHQTENEMNTICKQWDIKRRRREARSIQITIELIDVIWIEIPIVKSSLFTKQVPLRTLFIFYLLAGTFEIVTSRSAILNWEDEPIREGGIFRVLHATETINLIYRLRDYENWMLKLHCNCDRIAYQKPHKNIKKMNLHYYNRRLSHFMKSHNELLQKLSYYYAGLDHAERYPHYQVSSLTHLCLSILISLSDLFCVKHKRNFPDIKYQENINAKCEMISKNSLR